MLALVPLGLVTAGCSGHRAFVAELERICASYEKQAKAIHLPREFSAAYLRKHAAYLDKHHRLKLTRKAARRIRAYQRRIEALLSNTLHDLEAVRPPADDARRYAALLHHYRRSLHYHRAGGGSIRNELAINHLSHSLGLSTCFYDPELDDVQLK
jgi:hypothetical protein